MEKYLNKYRGMSVVKKFAFWGSVCSILALPLGLYSLAANSGDINIDNSGNNNPVVTSPSGDVNINYSVNNHTSGSKYRLVDQQGGRPPLLVEPNLAYILDSDKHVCWPHRGDEIRLLGVTAKEQGMDFWEKVEVLETGKCQGKVGWVIGANITKQ